MNYVLIAFESPHHTIKADKLLETAKIKCAIYPIPREISKDCSLGLKILSTDLKKALALFNRENVLYQKTFRLKFISEDQLN